MSAEKEIPARIENASQLIDDFELRQDAEFFSDAHNRVEFLKSLDFDDFHGIAQHVNARVRDFEPRDGKNRNDKGGYLPMLGTPKAEDKPEAFRKGFDVISKYLHESEDTPEEKLRGASMAAEALVIWVHPFNDGNGRTSRFIGKFIRDGTTDTERLIAETADSLERLTDYNSTFRIDPHTLDPENEDLLIDDDEREEIRQAQAAMPVAEGIAKSIDRILHNTEVQDRIDAKTKDHKAVRAAYLDRKANGTELPTLKVA